MEKTTEQKLKEYKEQSRYCHLCRLENIERESLFDGCSIQIVGITEDGQVMNPYDNEFQGMTVMLPMCAYHMVLSQEGVLAQTMQGEIIQSKIFTNLEPQADSQLMHLILKLQRGNTKDELNKATIGVAKTIIQARKFQREMEKGVENAKEKLKLSEEGKARHSSQA